MNIACHNNKIIKVAAYCRVSTDKDDQANSFASQKRYFKEYIARRADWQIADIYADEGLSGTSTKKRTAFNRMIQDAYDGKFSYIITKEVSRFARNTVDTLQYTRSLKEKHVGVLFLNDNINSLDPDAELRLSIMASIAQEESRKTSERVKWGIKRQMENGFVFSPPLLGYDYTKGVLTVNPEEAKIVERIYELYVNEEMSTVEIARLFEKTNVPKSKRIKNWSPTTIARILRNEKYVGDLLQKKTVTPNFLTHTSVKNNGIEEKIFCKDHHEAIVSREIWNEAQQILQARCSYNGASRGSHNHRFWCSGKVFCGICGGSFVTKTKKAQYGMIRVWKCRHITFSNENPDGCTNKTYIDERILKACMKYVLSRLTTNQESIIRTIKKAFHSCELNETDDNIFDDLAKLHNKRKRIVDFLLDGTLSKEDYKNAVSDIDIQIQVISSEIERKNSLKEGIDNTSKKIQEIIEYVKKYINQDVDTPDLYSSILNKLVVYPNNMVCVSLNGISESFSIEYCREGRGAQYAVECKETEALHIVG